MKAFHILSSSAEMLSSPCFFSHRDADTSGNGWKDKTLNYTGGEIFCVFIKSHPPEFVLKSLLFSLRSTLTLIFPKSICFWMVYMCSVLSILLAPSLQLSTNCRDENIQITISRTVTKHRWFSLVWFRRSVDTLLMACRAHTAAKYSAVFSGVFWQMVWERKKKISLSALKSMTKNVKSAIFKHF